MDRNFQKFVRYIEKQNDDIEKNIKYYEEMNKLTERLYNESKEDEIELTTYAKYIKENWMIKKRMSKSITTKHIEQLIESCMQRGAIACKLLGAGGGGYVFVIAPNKESMKNQLLNEGHYVEDIKYDPMGSKSFQHFHYEKVIIIGANGFIGKELVKRMKDRKMMEEIKIYTSDIQGESDYSTKRQDSEGYL